MRSRLFLLPLLILITLPGVSAAGVDVVGDSLYSAHHPRLLFSSSDVPALRARVSDGGYDAAAYDYIRDLVTNVLPALTPKEFFDGNDIGISDVPNLGLYAFIEEPSDPALFSMGRDAVDYLVDSTTVDNNPFDSSLRLRSMSIGYDLFYADATPELRGKVVSQIETYVDTMLTGFWYDVWKRRPFLSNFTPMIAGSIGLAAITLDGETDPARVQAALAMADDFVETWLDWQMDPDGSYKEGAMYAGWSMRHLVYYFWARKRYDGKDWGADPRVRRMENWVAFSLLPVGEGEVNNINDTASRNYPWARHHAYLDYAQAEWASGLSLWLWERLAGPYGQDAGRLKDAAATVLWNRDIAPVNPRDVLPHHFLWRDRGLYYYRTGWPDVNHSGDVVFSFYSGIFQGGHAQEDQGNFTLYGYGERFAMDNGFLRQSWETEAHNLILIDGRGQHNAGATIGTDGEITDHLLGGFADFLSGDLTRAYTTHSDLNNPDVPYVGMDWSWGYDGGNPVEYATRRVVVVHGGGAPPYVVLLDDIEKDGAVHTYRWRMHTDEAHAVDVSANPVTITGTSGHMALHVIAPAWGTLTPSLGAFDNGHDDPNSTVIQLDADTTAVGFAFLLLPAPAGTPTPPVTTTAYPWGTVSEMSWSGSGSNDVVVVNRSGGAVSFVRGGETVTTDATVAVLRGGAGAFACHLLTDATTLALDGTPLVTISDGPADVSLSGDAVELGRTGARYRVYAPAATGVYHDGESLAFARDGDYVVTDTTGGVRPPSISRIAIGVYPTPFRSATTVVVSAPGSEDVTIAVFDALGRRVARAVRRNPDGVVRWHWHGVDDRGGRVPSGVYFVRARAGRWSAAQKVVIVR